MVGTCVKCLRVVTTLPDPSTQGGAKSKHKSWCFRCRKRETNRLRMRRNREHRNKVKAMSFTDWLTVDNSELPLEDIVIRWEILTLLKLNAGQWRSELLLLRDLNESS